MKKQIVGLIVITALASGLLFIPRPEQAMSQPPADPNMIFEVTSKSLTQNAITVSYTLSFNEEVLCSASASANYSLTDGLTQATADTLAEQIQAVQLREEAIVKQKLRPGYIDAEAILASKLDLRVE